MTRHQLHRCTTLRCTDPPSDLPVADLLKADDRIIVRFASGQESPVVGIGPLRTTTGASRNWQVLLPADRASDVGIVGWREQHERGAS